MPSSFDYAVVRIVPLVERQEFFNAGVVLFCPQQRFLAARVHLDATKLAVFAPSLPPAAVQARLLAIERICHGDLSAGPIAAISQSARFHWLTAPRSTLLQVSPVHSGLCEDPAAMLTRLFGEQVLSAPVAE